MKLLLFVDTADKSPHAIAETVAGPWPAGSELIIAAAPPPGGFKKGESKDLLDHLTNLVKSKTKAFTEIEAVALSSAPKTELVDLAEKAKSELIIVGAHERISAGKSSQSLLPAVGCSLRIARRQTNEVQPHRIMLVQDGTMFSAFAMEQLLSRPWPAGTDIVCVAAVPALAEHFQNSQDYLPAEGLQSDHQKLVERANLIVKRTSTRLSSELPDCNIRTLVLDGDPVTAIVNATEEERTNLLILGSANNGLLQKPLGVSVVERIASNSKCSVEVVRHACSAPYEQHAAALRQSGLMKILVALDETVNSEYAADVILARDWPAYSNFKLLSVVEDTASSRSAASAEKLLKHTADRLRDRFPNADVTHQVLYGNCKDTILDFAAEWCPDLIALGARGRTGLSRILLGSVSQTVLLYADASVLIARIPKTEHRIGELKQHAPKRILVPVDASEHSRRTLDWVQSMCWSNDCHFRILTVIPPMVERYSDGLSMLQGEKLSNERIKAKERGQQLVRDSEVKLQSRIAGSCIDTMVVEGDVGESILKLANDWPADLIVMGTRGHSGLKKLWLGSVAQEIVLQSPCPVEVVKKQPQEACQ